MDETLHSRMANLALLFDGNMGWTILALALVVRMALLPLTLRLARWTVTNQEKVKALQPQVDAIRKRLADDPQTMFAAISALYKTHGAHLFDRSSLTLSRLVNAISAKENITPESSFEGQWSSDVRKILASW